MRALLDVNVLIAVHDRDHIHHLQAASWFESNIEAGWASCTLTQNGCLRIMSQAGYSNPKPLATLVGMLQHSTATRFHAFWDDAISILDAKRFNHRHLHASSQLTDLYLLGLAVKHKARLASFDRRIPLSAVIGATSENLVTLI